jgi:tripartite-type tricarboxylate transporter receptor subunit TctC
MPNIDRRSVLKRLGVAAGVSIMPSGLLAANWPTQRITLVVGFNPGGGIDTVSRALVPHLEKFLNTSVRVVNQPGAAATVATDFVWQKPADGHWWLACSGYNRSARALGQHTTIPYRDWQFYGIDSSIMSWAVVPESPIKDFGDFLQRVRSNSDGVRVSNSGAGDAWHIGNLLLERAANVKLRQIPFGDGDGVTPALKREVEVSAAGIHEQIQHIAAGRLRNLAVATSEALQRPEGKFDSVTRWVPELKALTPIGGGVTLCLRRDTDPVILQQMANAIRFAMEQEEIKTLLRKLNRVPAIYAGAEADRKAASEETTTTALLREAGLAKLGPKDLGLPKIEDFDAWWPPKDYKPAF